MTTFIIIVAMIMLAIIIVAEHLTFDKKAREWAELLDTKDRKQASLDDLIEEQRDVIRNQQIRQKNAEADAEELKERLKQTQINYFKARKKEEEIELKEQNNDHYFADEIASNPAIKYLKVHGVDKALEKVKALKKKAIKKKVVKKAKKKVTKRSK